MLACQMSQSEEGVARIEAMCALVLQFFYIFIYNQGYSLLLFHKVINICFAIEIEHTVCEFGTHIRILQCVSHISLDGASRRISTIVQNTVQVSKLLNIVCMISSIWSCVRCSDSEVLQFSVVLSTIPNSAFPVTIRGLSHLSLASPLLVVDVDSESKAMSQTIWVSVFPGTIVGLSHLSLALLS